MNVFTFALASLLIALSACSRITDSTSSVPAIPITDSSSEGDRQFLKAAENAEYVFASNAIRQLYAHAGKSFRFRFVDGQYQSQDSALLRPYDSATVLRDFVRIGTLSGSTEKRLLVPLEIGSDVSKQLEIAVLTMSGSSAMHLYSYPMGHAKLLSITVQSGLIHATIEHQMLLDPTRRKTEYVLRPLVVH